MTKGEVEQIDKNKWYSQWITGKNAVILKKIADILYPEECPVCQKILAEPEDRKMHVHRGCYRKLKRITEPMCKCCGKPVMSLQQEYCFDCSKRTVNYEAGHSLWVYDAVSSESVFHYKYSGKQSYADFYAEAMVCFYGEWIDSLQVQQIIPVPLSRQKLKIRGYNQAGILAEKIGDKLQIPVNNSGLFRIHSTAPQKELGKAEREKILRDAFRANEKHLTDIRRVLLIDDIYTTGSTVNYCAGALRAAGVKKVWFLTLCTGAVF